MTLYFIYALSLINGTSVRASNLVLVLYALKLGASPAAIGVLAAMFFLLPALLAVTAGKMADRLGARWLLVATSTLSGLGMLLPYFVPGLAPVFIAAVATGLATTFLNVSCQNLVGILSVPANRTQNFSNYALIQSVSSLLGPLIAGFSSDHAGYAAACVHIALIMLAPALLLALWGGMLPGGESAETQASGGVREMLRDRDVRKTLATSSILLATITLYQFYMPVYAQSVGLSASVIGMVMATNSAAAFVVRGALPRLVARFRERAVLVYAFYIGAASLMLVPFFESALVLGLLSFVFGLGIGCGQPLINMLMFSSAAKGRSGEALGLKMTVNNITKVASPMAFGVIASAFGLPPIFWLNAVILWAGGVLGRPAKER